MTKKVANPAEIFSHSISIAVVKMSASISPPTMPSNLQQSTYGLLSIKTGCEKYTAAGPLSAYHEALVQVIVRAFVMIVGALVTWAIYTQGQLLL